MIVNVEGTGKKTTIGKLRGGDCFYWWGNYYMKLPRIVDTVEKGKRLRHEFNSARLSDGGLVFVGEKDEIVPVKAVVTIDLKKS